MRRLVGAAILFASVGASSAAGARPNVAACIDAHTEAQVLRRDGHFRQAKEKLRICVQDACPAIARKDCATWLGEIEHEEPTIVVVANGVTEGTIVVDGESMGPLDGRAIPVDPGRHVVRIESGGETKETALLVAVGDHNRRVELEFRRPVAAAPPPAPAPERPPASSGPPVLTYVLGGVSIAALGSFGGFALAGKGDERCVPTCSQDQIDDFRRSYLIADVSLGVGLLAAAGAIWLALARR